MRVRRVVPVREQFEWYRGFFSVSKQFETEFFLFGINRFAFGKYRKGMIELANETQTARSEKTDLKTQLAEVAERIRTMRDIMGLSEEEMAQRTGVTVEE